MNLGASGASPPNQGRPVQAITKENPDTTTFLDPLSDFCERARWPEIQQVRGVTHSTRNEGGGRLLRKLPGLGETRQDPMPEPKTPAPGNPTKKEREDDSE